MHSGPTTNSGSLKTGLPYFHKESFSFPNDIALQTKTAVSILRQSCIQPKNKIK